MVLWVFEPRNPAHLLCDLPPILPSSTNAWYSFPADRVIEQSVLLGVRVGAGNQPEDNS